MIVCAGCVMAAENYADDASELVEEKLPSKIARHEHRVIVTAIGDAEISDQGIEIQVFTDGSRATVHHFLSSESKYLVVDVSDAVNRTGRSEIDAATGQLGRIRVVQTHERVRLVFSLNEAVSGYEVISLEDGFKVSLKFGEQEREITDEVTDEVDDQVDESETKENVVRVQGKYGVEYRHFNVSADDANDSHHYSLVVAPELSFESEDRKNKYSFQPFFRLDEHDDERSYFDIRELLWARNWETWRVRAGIGKVFWGVTESINPVDIVNQTDLVGNNDGSEKLGQPMLNVTKLTDWGNIETYLLPGFRERTYPGIDGRLQTVPRIQTDLAQFESDDGDRHIDIALRWSHTLGAYDIGLSHFRGTSREPRLVPVVNNQDEVVLSPIYDLISQTGIEVQGTYDSFILKSEAIYRTGEQNQSDTTARQWAAVLGLEYSIYSVFDKSGDVELFLEYLYDSRGKPQPFDDDILLGFRLVSNDVQSTELEGGVIYDLDTSGLSYNLEFSRRIRENWRMSLKFRGLSNISKDDALFGLRNEDFIQFDMNYFF